MWKVKYLGAQPPDNISRFKCVLERPSSISLVVQETCCPVSKLATVWNEPHPNSLQYSTSYRWRLLGHLALLRYFVGPVAFPPHAIWASEAIWPSRVQSELDKSWAVGNLNVYISHFWGWAMGLLMKLFWYRRLWLTPQKNSFEVPSTMIRI